MGFPGFNIKIYDSGSQGLQELLKVDGISSVLCEFSQNSENNVVTLVKAECLCGHDDISEINSSLPGVSIEWKQGVEFYDVLTSEDGAFSGNFLREDSLEVLFLDFFSWHYIFV